jgi:dehydrogenase/reductase SDR family protein 12
MVTSASSGIGKAKATGLAKMGGGVVIVCRDQKRGNAAKSDIVAGSGNEAIELMLADLSCKNQSEILRRFSGKDTINFTSW